MRSLIPPGVFVARYIRSHEAANAGRHLGRMASGTKKGVVMTDSTARPHAVVLHVSDDPADVSRAVAAANSLAETHPDLGVRVIVNGAALEGLTSAGITLAPVEGASVEACSVGMKRRNMSADQLQPVVHTVASAVSALVEAQLAGAAYVRL